MKNLFARKSEVDEKYYNIFNEDGSDCRRIDANVYPVGSGLSARYDHPEGIMLSLDDVKKLGIEIES